MRIFTTKQAYILSAGLQSQGLPSIHRYLMKSGRLSIADSIDPYAKSFFQREVAIKTKPTGPPTVLSLLEGPPEKGGDKVVFKFSKTKNLTSSTVNMRDFNEDLAGYIGKAKIVVFDLKDINWLDKECVGKFLSMHSRLQKEGKHLVFTNLQEDITERLKQLCLDKHFFVASDLTNASLSVDSRKILILKQAFAKDLPPVEKRSYQTIGITKLSHHDVYVIKFKDHESKFLEYPDLLDLSTLKAELKGLFPENKKFVFDLPDKFGDIVNSSIPTISEALAEVKRSFKDGKNTLVVKCKNNDARNILKDLGLTTDDSFTGAVLKAVNNVY